LLALRAFFQGSRVVFDPEAVAFDTPAVSGTEFRRRLRTLGGLWQMHARLPALFTSANRMRFHFLSHKFSRLLLPWAILLGVLSSLALPSSPWQKLIVACELSAFALALADAIVPSRFPLKRLTSPIRTFLVMNLAAMLAPVVFVTPAQRLWNPTRVD